MPRPSRADRHALRPRETDPWQTFMCAPPVAGRRPFRKSVRQAENITRPAFGASIAEIVELQRPLELALAQERHRELEIIPFLAADAQLVAVDLRLDLELRGLDLA